MSDSSTKRLIKSYMEEATAPMFLSGFFKSPASNFHTSELVEIDVMRDDEDVAVVVQDLTVGARANESTKYTNKGFTPPIYDEEGTITAFDQMKRQPGVDPFKDPGYAANAMSEAFRIFSKLERKIRRAIEWQSSQVLQTGTLDLTDGAGASLYTLDFKPQTTHVVTTSVAWATDGTTGNPLADLEALATVVRRDGKKRPTKIILGASAYQRLLANDDVKNRLDNRAMDLGTIAPEVRGEGASFQGWLWIGHYRFELWMYDGFFKHPQTGVPTPYVDDEKLIMLSDGGRLDLTFGAIPILRTPTAPAMSFLPGRMSSSDRGLDLTTNAWFTPDGKHLKVSAGTRPLTIPTAIDTFASLKVTT